MNREIDFIWRFLFPSFLIITVRLTKKKVIRLLISD